MYRAYEFTFAGIPASSFGMFVSDVGDKKHTDNGFANKAKIVETRLANRITPLHFGVRYHDEPLKFPLIFGSKHEMDRYQMQAVANWLTGYQDYQWLSIDQPDMEQIQFRCLIQSLTPISVGWFPVAFEAEIVCDCPYGYSYPFEEQIEVKGRSNYLFYNDSTIKALLRPFLKIELAQDCSSFSIANKTTGSIMQFLELPSGGITILIDSENEVLREEKGRYNLYQFFNFQFFEVSSGCNELVFEGNGTVTISGQYLYNMGA